MTSYAVFPSVNRLLSDIYEDELYHVNQNQQQSNSPILGTKSGDSELSHNTFSFSDLDLDMSGLQHTQPNKSASNNYIHGSNPISNSVTQPAANAKSSFFNNYSHNSSNEQAFVQPFNEYANPDLDLNESFNGQQQLQQIPLFSQNVQFNPFEQKPNDDFLNVSIYDYDNENADEMVPPYQKHNLDNMPSMYLQPMELPDEDLEDYDSEDDDEDDDKLYDIVEEFMPKESNLYRPETEYPSDNVTDVSRNISETAESTPGTSVSASPLPVDRKPSQDNSQHNYIQPAQQMFKKSLSNQPTFFMKHDIFNENAIVDEDDEIEGNSMELDSSDSSDYEDNLYLPKFDNNALFEKTSRSHSFVNNDNHDGLDFESLDLRSHSNDNTHLQTLSDNIININLPQKSKLSNAKLNSSPTIFKTKHRKSQSQPQPQLQLEGMAVDPSEMGDITDMNNQCMLLNPATNQPCLKKFSRPYDLIRHQETIHATKKKIFRCVICESNYKKSMNNAISNNDGSERPSHAPKTFSRGDALSRHIRVKHGLTGNAVAEAIKYAKDNVEYVYIQQ